MSTKFLKSEAEDGVYARAYLFERSSVVRNKKFAFVHEPNNEIVIS